jgi:hypothetical protein
VVSRGLFDELAVTFFEFNRFDITSEGCVSSERSRFYARGALNPKPYIPFALL